MANIVSKKLYFSNSNNIPSSGNVVRVSSQTIQDISSSPRFINYIEPVTIAGYIKSAFYTEIDSNLKIGDRIFIVNGYYDSSSLISSDKYKKGRDGYKILDIDRCKVTLDIDYTGVLPWIDDSLDNFIKVYYIKNQREFDYFNKQFISRDGYVNKFELHQNNFIYVDGAYNGILSGFGKNSGVTQSGFYGITQSNWQLITSDLLSNNLSFSQSLSINFPNNGRIKVMNGTFINNLKEWRESDIYQFDDTVGGWVLDINYTRPFITKSNFRGGNFKGDWNKGIYGSYDKKIKWTGTSSNWNNGTVINVDWITGSINSNFSPTNSYFSELDVFGLPIQKVNINNNRGFGYNYFIDMDISSSIINNGNYINCNIGSPATFSAVDGYYQQWNDILSNKINSGEFTSCNFESTSIKNSVVKSSRIENTYIESSKSINSHFSNSVFYRSNYESDNLIKIKAYDEWNISLGTQSVDNYKMYKFYLSDKDFERLKSLDKFYIKGLEVKTSDYHTLEYEKLLNFFDRGFIMDSYSDSEDFFFSLFSFAGYFKYPVDIISKLSTKEENHWKLTSYFDGSNYSTATYSINDINMASVDILVRSGVQIFQPNYNYDFSSSLSSPSQNLTSLGNNIDITNAYIVDSYFDSGLFEQSNWNNGRYYNYNLDNNIHNGGSNTIQVNNSYELLDQSTSGQLSISYAGSQLIVQIPNNTTKGIKDNYINAGDIVYLNAIDYNDGLNVTRLPNIYKVVSNNTPGLTGGYNSCIIEEYLIGTSSSVISSLTGSGVFLTSPDGLTSSVLGRNRYNHIHKLRINNSSIKNGMFRRAFISGSNIESSNFNNSDYKFDNKPNIKELMFFDSIMSDNSNNIKSGIFINSYFKNGSDTWNNGIAWKSIWESGKFNNGIIKESNWINGVFNSGMFYNSKSSFFINNKNSYYKSGAPTSPNDRATWIDGVFNNGDFFDSIWENGIFNNGKIYKSSWTNGVFNNGIFGDSKFNTTDNNFYSGTFSNGLVINSNFYSGFKYSTGFNGINWINGVFQSGVFKNDTTNPLSKALWYDGTFNGGEFTNTSIWYNGTFNDGKFTSYYGSTLSISNNQSDYGWQNGIFNGGEFGTADGMTNSTWFNGEMNGGVFKGKIWNNGLFTSGEIQGSATISCVGGLTSSNASMFVDSFSQSYYGLWRDGIVTNIKDKFIKHKELFTPATRKSDEPIFSEKVNRSKAVIKNALWMSGTFSHQNGEANNVVWLDGTFELGKFNSGSFNPYVKRNGSSQSSFNLNDDTCVWKDGDFNGGDFYISNWEKGNFIMGTGIGMIWKNGVNSYMNAFNIFWENGTWKNGNWYGSSFQLNGEVTEDYTKQILFRGMSWSGTSSCHIWNIFDDTINTNVQIYSITPSEPILSDLGEFYTDRWISDHWAIVGTGLGVYSNPGYDIEVGLSYKGITKTYSSTKTYQIITDIRNYISSSFSMQFPGGYSLGNITTETGNYDSVAGMNPTTGADGNLYFYSTLPSTQRADYPVYYKANLAFGSASSPDASLQGFIVNEIDWKVQGFSWFHTYAFPGTINVPDDIIGWYSGTNSHIWYDNNSATKYPAGGSYGSKIGHVGYRNNNYIAQFVGNSFFNVSFFYNKIAGGVNDGIKIYLSPTLPTTTAGTVSPPLNSTLLATITQSGSTFSTFYGLAGNQYIYFVGTKTSTQSVILLQDFKIEGGYDQGNNLQYLTTNSSLYSEPTQIIPLGLTGVTYSAYSGYGNTVNATSSLTIFQINSNLGNGSFKSGVWENGVWNSGWRYDDGVYEFYSIDNFYDFNKNKQWRFLVTGPESSVINFNIGDRVSIGNIIAIDINEDRKLIKSYFTIIDKSATSLIVELTNNFPLRRINIDSTNHRIYMTKNVWLSGGFLNGYFKGVWNYGLFKGFPRITEMYNSHWIDGVFDGGHYFANLNSVDFVDTIYTPPSGLSGEPPKLGLTFSVPHRLTTGDLITIDKSNKLVNPQYDGTASVVIVVNEYQIITDIDWGVSSASESGTINTNISSGVIQNFNFKSNNLSKITSIQSLESDSVFVYNSWIDVNYNNNSAVNIGKPQTLIDTTSRRSYSENNLFGYPTNDVLSSVSTFRDSFSLTNRSYKLGTKYKIFNDYIGDSSKFEDYFGATGPDADLFISQGWTYSISGYLTFSRTVDTGTDPIIGEELNVTALGSGGSLDVYQVGGISNRTNNDIEKLRYTVVEFDMLTYSVVNNGNFVEKSSAFSTKYSQAAPISEPVLHFNNINRIVRDVIYPGDLVFPTLLDATYLPVYQNINHLLTPGIKKYEYFYNKRNLSMFFKGGSLFGAGESDFTLDNLKFYEIDMVPFFQYFTEDNINFGVQVPYQGIAPFIDYTNSNFSFIDNISIGLGSIQTQQSFLPISGVGTGIGHISSGNTFVVSTFYNAPR